MYAAGQRPIRLGPRTDQRFCRRRAARPLTSEEVLSESLLSLMRATTYSRTRFGDIRPAAGKNAHIARQAAFPVLISPMLENERDEMQLSYAM